MRWHNVLAAAGLLFVAAALCIANLWFAAARSTIPLRLDAVVAGKVVRQEKHPPKDDVCLLRLTSKRAVHVDRSVFDQLAVNDRLSKERWSHKLLINDQPVELIYSADLQGMVRVMPLAWLLFAAAAVWACRFSEGVRR